MAVKKGVLFAGVVGFEGVGEHFEGVAEVVDVEHVGHAHFVAAGAGGGVEAGGGGHHHGAAFVLEFAQAPGAEVFGVVDGKAGHGVEGAHGDGGVDAGYAVESVDEAFAAFDIFVVDVAAVFLWGVDGCFGGNLADERGARDGPGRI